MILSFLKLHFIRPKTITMKRKLLGVILPVLLFVSTTQATTRYLDEVFTDVTVTSNVQYGQNVTIITGSPALENLMMDIYEPTGDVLTSRPLIVYLHTGSFLPVGVNGQCTGDKRDSAVVEMCNRFAKKGYVVAAINYRLGWNPVGDQDTRTGTLLNAVYRALQDAKSCVRYFRKSVATMSNPYRIDESRIVVGGQGSGGYVSLAYGTIDDYGDITLPKFINFNTGQPYVDTTLSGDWHGMGGNGLNQPALNNPGYSNEVHFIFNMGGAMGDSSWLQAGAPPMVCAHIPNDPFAPYTYGPVIVPTTGQFVVNVSGSRDVIRRANYLGNNNVFIGAGLTDPFTLAANIWNEGYDGLVPLLRPDPPGPLTGEAGPWEWWDTTCAQNSASLASNPDMSKAKGMAYIDTVQGYFCPRMYIALGLNVGVNELSVLQQNVKLYPNPAADRFRVAISASTEIVNLIQIQDISGRTLHYEKGDERRSYDLDASGLPAGLYFVRLSFPGGDVVKKLMVQ